jgi:hypothetical protein
LEPSGDQAGKASLPGEVVSCCAGPVPSALATKMSYLVPPARWPEKATFVPPGEKSGKIIRPPVCVT